MRIERDRLALCSWSLGNDPRRIASVFEATGIRGLHLDVAALKGADAGAFATAIRSGEWRVSALMIAFDQEDYASLESIRKTGGIVPDADWPRNRLAVLEGLDRAKELGVGLLSFHAGFIDASSGNRSLLLDRMRELADAAAERDVGLLMETGQEPPEALRDFLETASHPALGVNFDPANVILYGVGNPLAAVRILAPWIRHVHVKDALPASLSGRWGSEVPWGAGAVGAKEFLSTLREIGYAGTLAVEREAGEKREADVRHALGLLLSGAEERTRTPSEGNENIRESPSDD